MPRADTYLDAMLRNLGAAYYESLHGRATRGGVSRALDTVEDVLQEQGHRAVPGSQAAGEHRLGHDEERPRQPGRWSGRISDVMTTSVVTVDRTTPYKEIARLLAEHQISGVPVLTTGREVVGVVTESDLLTAPSRTVRRKRVVRRAWRARRRDPALTAGELMAAPALTISPHATIPAAARLMSTHHIRRLPVVNDDGELAGIVSSRDLLSVFSRPDQDIADDIRQVLDDILEAGPADAEASVQHGIVTLTGPISPETRQYRDRIPIAIRLIWDVDGVVDVINKLGVQAPAAAAPDRQFPLQADE